ncbi:MAG TPA: hypothetical protein VFK57_18675 [Vicinamibacterales bacterium]|nr:hypothetical protein [Vicinamibacterales bacterium]
MRSAVTGRTGTFARAAVLLLLAARAAAGPLPSTDPLEHFTIDICLRLPRSIPPQIAPLLKSEVEAIWAPYSVRLQWAADGNGSDAPRALSLDASVERDFQQHSRTGWPMTLGEAALGGDLGAAHPIRVSFDATEQVLADRSGRPAPPGMVRDAEMALALGRVLAHEIGHVLLGPPFHDRDGLMRASFRPGELAEPDRAPFQLTCSGVVRLRNRLRALAREPLLDYPVAPCIRPETTTRSPERRAGAKTGVDEKRQEERHR